MLGEPLAKRRLLLAGTSGSVTADLFIAERKLPPLALSPIALPSFAFGVGHPWVHNFVPDAKGRGAPGELNNTAELGDKPW